MGPRNPSPIIKRRKITRDEDDDESSVSMEIVDDGPSERIQIPTTTRENIRILMQSTNHGENSPNSPRLLTISSRGALEPVTEHDDFEKEVEQFKRQARGKILSFSLLFST